MQPCNHATNNQKVYKLLLILTLISCAILHTEYTLSQGQGQGLWNAIGQDGVTTNRQVSIYNDLSVAGNAIFDSSLTALSLYSYYLSVSDNTNLNRLTVGGDARFYRNTYIDSLLTANEIRVQLLKAGIIIGDSAELESVVSTFINAARINGIDIYSTKITTERINTDTVITVVLSCGNAQFTGTVFTSDIITGNISVTGTSNLNKIIVSDEVSITSLAGSNQGLIQYDTTGKLTRLDFTSNPNEVLTGNGTFQNINTLVPRDTGWQWYDTTVLLSTAPIVAIQNNLVVGNRVSIGSLRMSNGSATDTMTTDRRFALEAAKILLKADTVQLQNYATARQITADTLTTNKYAKVGSDTSKYNPPVTGTLALEVAGSATVKGDVAVKGDIAANDLSISTAVSSPKVVTSRITSPDSLIYFGDSSMSVIINCPERILSGCRNMVMGGKPTLSQFRLGIGKLASSNYTLDVSGAVNATDYFKNGQALKEGLWNDGGSGNIYYNSGNVGIGTSEPDHLLDVNGPVGIVEHLIFMGASTDGVVNWPYDKDFMFRTNSTPGNVNNYLTRMVIRGGGNGNVGIGTESPQKKLHVYTFHYEIGQVGEGIENPDEGSHQGIRLENWVGSNSSIWDVEPIIDTGSKFTIGTPHRPRFTLQENGHAGFNTITPKNDLHLHSDSMVNYSSYVSPFNGIDPPPPGLPMQVGLDIMQITNATTGKAAGDGLLVGTFSKEVFFVNQENGPMKFATNDSTRMTITALGHIGIGTKTPQATFDINGTFRLNNGTQQQGYVLTSDIDGNGSWQPVPVGVEWTQSGNDIYNNNTENVGIGTTSPQAKLHVKSPGTPLNVENALFKVEQFSNTEWAAEIYNGGGSGKGLRILADGGSAVPALRVDMASNGNTIFNVLANGKVIIGGGNGITSGAHDDFLLAVNGKAVAKVFKVTTSNWGDYVLQKGYFRMSLLELEEYINRYGVLPGMPTEQEIIKNGIDLGEMSKLHQVKLEENYLYDIDQQKEIEELKQEIKALKKERKEMRKENKKIKEELEELKMEIKKLKNKK